MIIRINIIVLLLFTFCSQKGENTKVSYHTDNISVENSVRDTIQNTVFVRTPRETSRFKSRIFQQVPSIATTGKGEQIFVAWYSGGENEGAGNYITLAVSLDKGNTWQKDCLIIYPKDSTTRFFDPALWRDHFGVIHLYYASSENPLQLEKYKLYDLKAGVNELIIRWDGQKIEYDSLRRISDGIMMNKPVYIDGINSDLFPVSLWKPWIDDYQTDPNYIGDGAFVSLRKYSGEQTNIKLLPYSSIEFKPEKIRKIDEHMVAQISLTGDLICLIRTEKGYGIYHSRSSDYGRTWSEPKPFTASGPTTASRFYISRLKSGNLLLILNNSETRTNMTAFISEDGGYTWPHKLLLDDRVRVSYPDADQTEDGTIHVVFDHDRHGTGEILYCRFSENDIVEGNQAAVFKKRISPQNIKQ